GIPLQSAYCGAKHGIQGFFDSLRSELIHEKINIDISMVHLPALNTTQFQFVKSRLPNKPRPMGTIFQPEVAARAIVFAATTPRRGMLVGLPTLQSVWGNKFIPGLLDHYLAKIGYEGQQTQEPADPNQPHNLWEPIPGDHGAHGRFDNQSKQKSVQLWAAKNRDRIGWATAGSLVLGLAVLAWGRFFNNH
ncbi:MAG: short-chain dehydrogenase, partial [Bacteroidia bacterium]|nr:short-chain dehydrogenase [Bacteroidia bacterium]